MMRLVKNPLLLMIGRQADRPALTCSGAAAPFLVVANVNFGNAALRGLYTVAVAMIDEDRFGCTAYASYADSLVQAFFVRGGFEFSAHARSLPFNSHGLSTSLTGC
jgi:hypothetical protein